MKKCAVCIPKMGGCDLAVVDTSTAKVGNGHFYHRSRHCLLKDLVLDVCFFTYVTGKGVCAP